MLIRRLKAGADAGPGWWKGKISGGGDSDTITLVTSSVAVAMGVRENGKLYLS